MMLENADTQSWVTKTVWQWIPSRQSRNSKNTYDHNCPVDNAERNILVVM